MATVKIEDIIQSTLWTQDFINEDPTLQNILNSGIITTNDSLQKITNAVEAGTRFELPYVDEPEYFEPSSMDDSDDEIVPNKVSWDNMFAVLHAKSASWAYANITQMINRDSDPAKVLREIMAKYWAKDLQARILASIVGVSIKAGADLTLDVADDTADGESVLLDSDVIIDAVGLQGDNQDKFGYMFVHSKVYGDLKKQNLIDTIQPKDIGAEPIKMYGGYQVIVNDLMPVDDGDNKKAFTTLIAQNGMFGYAQKKLSDPFAVAVNEKAGNGAGKTELISRNSIVLHPVGFSWLKSGFNPTLADLKNDANWSNKFKVKQQRFVKIVTN